MVCSKGQLQKSIYPTIYLSISIYLPTYLSIIHPSTYLSVRPSIYLLYPSIHLSIYDVITTLKIFLHFINGNTAYSTHIDINFYHIISLYGQIKTTSRTFSCSPQSLRLELHLHVHQEGNLMCTHTVLTVSDRLTDRGNTCT